MDKKNSSIPKERMDHVISNLDGAFFFAKSRNSELRLRWYSILLKHGDVNCVPDVVEFITSQGRMKYVRPLYRLLSKNALAFAQETLKKNEKFYHGIALKMLKKDLHV
jgi:leukotriene-A4 hydrolase